MRSAPRFTDPPESVLVVLPTWVGDCVMATPALRGIRRRFAEARITFLMNPNLGELVRGGDWMDECIEWPAEVRSSKCKVQKEDNGTPVSTETLRTSNFELQGLPMHRPRGWMGFARTLRARRFDLAILLPNSFRAAWVAWCSGAKRRIGYARDGRSFLLTDRIPVKNRRNPDGFARRTLPASVRMGTNLPVRLGRYIPMPLVEYYADLAEAIGCDRPGHDLELFTTADCERSVESRLSSLGISDRRPLIVFSPGAKYGAAKCWPAERFAELADRLIVEHQATVVVTCGPGEEVIAQAIAAGMKCSATGRPSPRPSPWKGEGVRAVVLDSPLLTLGEMKSLIRRCDLWIGNDAGPRHIAKAFGIPAVTIFGPTHPDWTWTNCADERIVRIDVDCGPCQQRTCPLGHHQCMTGVSVDAVYAAAVSLLKKSQHPHASTR